MKCSYPIVYHRDECKCIIQSNCTTVYDMQIVFILVHSVQFI